MDTSVPDTRFDEMGTCNFCREYDERAPRVFVPPADREDALAAAVQRIKESGRHAKYDCIVGVSGGLDSTYAAYLAAKAGLRPLAVHVDNGWNLDLAVRNIQNVLKVLGMDLVTVVPDWEEFRDLQLAFIKASVPDMEAPTDHVLAAALYQVAREQKVHWLVTGANFASEGILPRSYGHYNRDLHYIKAIHRRFGTVPLRTLPLISIRESLVNRYVRGIRLFRILDVAGYDKQEASATLQKELGWVPYPGKHNESLFTRFFQCYIQPAKFDFDKRRAHFSTLICSGQMTREEALAEMEKDPYPSEELKQAERAFVVKKLGLTNDEFEALIALPNKTFRDYPSSHALFQTAQFLAKRGFRIGE
jgi:N-acetyl sugar amidotransferase